MKKNKIFKNLLFLAILTFVLVLPFFVFAETKTLRTLREIGKGAKYETATSNTTFEIIGTVIGIFLSFLGVIFTILIVYSGILWMTAKGNEEQMGKAMAIIKSSIIGLVIVTSSYAIWRFILLRVIVYLSQ